jgi:hypothetical protein
MEDSRMQDGSKEKTGGAATGRNAPFQFADEARREVEPGRARREEAVRLETVRERILALRAEVNCRIEHGAESGGHLDYVQSSLDEMLGMGGRRMDYNDAMGKAEAQVLRNEAYPVPDSPDPLRRALQWRICECMDVRGRTRFGKHARRYLEVAAALRHAVNELDWLDRQGPQGSGKEGA